MVVKITHFHQLLLPPHENIAWGRGWKCVRREGLVKVGAVEVCGACEGVGVPWKCVEGCGGVGVT